LHRPKEAAYNRVMRAPAPLLCFALAVTAASGAARAQAPLAAPPAPAQPTLSLGGLAPPSSDTAPPSGAGAPTTATHLEESRRDDSGRGLEFVYFDVGGGFEYAALAALSF
jgi:hypothetical protein